MHELGVVFHIADSVERIAQENGAAHVRKVALQIGEVSTVIPDYLLDVWKWNCKRHPMLEGCELTWEPIPSPTAKAAAKPIKPFPKARSAPTAAATKPTCSRETSWKSKKSQSNKTFALLLQKRQKGDVCFGNGK